MATHSEFNLRVSTVNRSLYSGQVISVTAPGTEGEMTILAHHEPFVTLLRKGMLTIRTTQMNEPVSIPVLGGVLETSANQMTVLI